MGCEEISESLDAYALGALSPDLSVEVERHVRECQECRSRLAEAELVVALLPLSAPGRTPRPRVRQRLMSMARRHAGLGNGGRLRFALPAAAALALALAGGALGWALSLQARVNDLNSDATALERQFELASTGPLVSSEETGRLAQEMARYGQMLGQQQAALAILASPDARTVTMVSSEGAAAARGFYFWSASAGSGGVAGVGLPALPGDKVYQMWLFRDGRAYSGGTFQPWNGVAVYAVDLRQMPVSGPFAAYGVSIEDAAMPAQAPTGDLVLFAENSAR